MILVLTGTQPLPFPRMISGVVSAVESGDVAQDVIVQRGATTIRSSHKRIRHFAQCTESELADFVRNAQFVVTHGGTASIVGALVEGRKVLVMPRLRRFGEHNDDHQVEIAEVFESAGFVAVWGEGVPFTTAIQQLQDFQPVPYRSSFSGIRDAVRADIKRFMNR